MFKLLSEYDPQGDQQMCIRDRIRNERHLLLPAARRGMELSLIHI